MPAQATPLADSIFTYVIAKLIVLLMDDDLVLNLVVDDHGPSAKIVSNKKGGRWTDRFFLYLFHWVHPI